MRGERLEVGEKIKTYKDLEVYQKGYELTLKIYQTTNEFPVAEKYELGRQLRRAAVSIPANIAEGYGRKKSSAEFKQFLRNAMGSANEVLVLLEIARDLGYKIPEGMAEEYEVLGKRIYKLIESWE